MFATTPSSVRGFDDSVDVDMGLVKQGVTLNSPELCPELCPAVVSLAQTRKGLSGHIFLHATNFRLQNGNKLSWRDTRWIERSLRERVNPVDDAIGKGAVNQPAPILAAFSWHKIEWLNLMANSRRRRRFQAR